MSLSSPHGRFRRNQRLGASEDRENLVYDYEARRFEEIYKSAPLHRYPNENIVRITRWFFKDIGRILDYGFGPGRNLLHFVEIGHHVAGIEVSANALAHVQRESKRLPKRIRPELRLLKPGDSRLPWGNDSFDYIVANQVLYFLGSMKRIERALSEFHRVLKPGGKIVVTMMSRANSAFLDGRRIGQDMYEYKNGRFHTEVPSRVFIFRDKRHVRRVFQRFAIREIGHLDNKYCGVSGHHYLILGVKDMP